MASPNTKKQKKILIEDNELYNTPEIALCAFYDQYPEVFDRFNVFYDPCNGLGVIADYLRSLGKKVYTGDLIDYGIGVEMLCDFTKIGTIPKGVECIIFNPPFTLTEEFIDKSLSLCDNLIMFNRMVTIESNKRANKFKTKKWKLTDMYQFGFRVSCSKGVNKEPTATSVAYSWFVFDNKSRQKHTKLQWITK